MENTTRIRPFNPATDYPLLAQISKTVWPDYAATEEEFRFRDENSAPHLIRDRFIAQDTSGNLRGAAMVSQSINTYHPQKFSVNIDVLPEHRRQGVGTALYQAMWDSIAPLNPIDIQATTQEDRPESLAFLTKLGFVEAMREWESRLKMVTFDTQTLQVKADNVATSGIVIKSYAELADDPERDQKIYELDCTVVSDMPSTIPFTKPDFAHFIQHAFHSPNSVPEAYFIAIDTQNQDKFVGETTLWRVEMGDYIETGATGILRAYRGRGIASALKLRAALYAKSQNIAEIRTWNAQKNREMLAINEKMGFIKQPAWIEMHQTKP
jgi:mycothiol synthase